jgi:outer membrane protein assembly factor BamB/subtilisin family serine protease
MLPSPAAPARRSPALASALLTLALAGVALFARSDAPAARYACNGAWLTEAEIAAARGLAPGMALLLRTQRGLTPADLCAMPDGQLARAVYRAENPRPDRPDEALAFRRLSQQDENGFVPPDGLLKAARHVQLMQASTVSASAAGLAPGAWTWLGPGNIGGRIRSILIHPTNPNLMWVGSVSGGIWKTTDGGATWQPVDDFMANLAVASLAMQPGNPSVMYAGTGEGFYNGDGIQGAGIFKSSDGGDTWAQLASTNNANFYYVNRLAISPNGAVILAATSSGIWRSTNGGASWTQALNDWRVKDLDFHPSDSNKAIGSGSEGKAWYSTNGGAGWTEATGLPAPDWLGRVETAYAPSNPAIVYASVNQNSGEIWKSADGGQSYALVNTGNNYLGGQGWYDNVLWVDPTNANTLVVGGIDLWRSTNGGANLARISQWWSAPLSAHADHHAIVEHPGFDGTSNKTVFFGNDGGLYRTSNVYTVSLTSGWQELNNNLGITQFYGAAGNPASGVIVGGTQDNGTLRYGGGTETWTTMFGGDGGFNAADPTDPNYFYGEYVYLTLHRSTDGGLSSWWVYNGISDANTCANFIAPFILDPNNPNTLLAGGCSLWRSANAKALIPTWAAIKPSTSGAISAIAVAQGNPAVIWVGHNTGDVFKTANGAAANPTWTRVDENSPGLPNRYVTRITIDKFNPDTAYVTFGGYSPDNVWRTTDGGATWSDRTGSGPTGLPDAPVRSLVINPANPNWLYAGTEVGVFASENAGAAWAVPQEGPANVSVDELFWMGNTLVAATHGRGLFSIDLSPCPACGLADSPWPMLRHDLQHTGRSANTGPNQPALDWSVSNGADASAPVLAPDGTIYVSLGDTFYAFNPDGTTQWSYPAGTSLRPAAVAANGNIYAGAANGSVYAFNPGGGLLWTYPTSGTITASPTIGLDGSLYIGSYDGYFYALNPNGTLKWRYFVGSWINPSAALGPDGTIYVGSTTSKVYALNPDGTLKWDYATGSYVDSSPAVGTDGTIYIGSVDQKLHALNPNGTLKWTYPTSGTVGSSPALGADGAIYVGSDDGKLYAINPNGTLRWSYATGGGITSSPAVDAEGVIYVDSRDGNLYALNPDGALKWQHTLGGWMNFGPVIGPNRALYIARYWPNGTLLALNEQASNAPYTDDFEGSVQGWQASGFWHRVQQGVSPYPEAHSPARSFWYGQDATGDYDSGAPNAGNLTSPPIAVPGPDYVLTFWSWYQTETSGTGWDQRLIQISTDGTNFTTVAQLSGDPMQTWAQAPAINLSAYAGQTIYVRFRFNTIDQYVNSLRGWYVDDISIAQSAQPPDIAVSPISLSAELEYGQTTQRTLTIANTGTGPLEFNLVEQNTTPAPPPATTLAFPAAKVEPGLAEALAKAPNGTGPFLVYLNQQADLSRAYGIEDWAARGQYVRDRLWATAQSSQAQALSFLNAQIRTGAVSGYRSFYIVNAVLVSGDKAALQALAARPDVAYIEAVKEYAIPAPIPAKDETSVNALEWGVAKIRADEVWADFGSRGEGIVVANIDTGVMGTHPALASQYRGAATGSDDYNWFDPTGAFPAAPGDNNGHGTHTMGTLVGDDGAGNQIGVAPGAKWIAAKGCASNACSSADLLAAAEWMLAPYPIGGGPAQGDAAKRPHVVNNSWGGSGGDLWYQASVNAWRAADIFPAFSGGNAGPDAGTIGSPGDYAEAFASGATDANDSIASFSSRGPSSVTDETKPDVSAPGVGVRSALNDGGYVSLSGTSMASPHTAGCAALLNSLDPSLTVADLEHLMTDSAVDLGVTGPDSDYGYGRLDCRAAASLISPVPWLAETPTAGTVLPGGAQVVTATFTANQPAGTYTANLIVNNNDPDENPVAVPVTLTVRAPDVLAAPPYLNEFAAPGSVLTRTLTLSNTGDAALSLALTDTGDNYYALASAFNWIDISATGTNLNLSDDSFAYLNLPFSVLFDGVARSSVAVGSNGIVYFENKYLGFSNTCLPASNIYGVSAYIAGLWDDLNPSAGGAVYYAVQGASPNRRLVVEWYNVPRYNNVGAATFEIVLYEGSDEVLIQYLDVNFGDAAYDGGASATSGIQINNSLGRQYHCNTAALADNLAVRYVRSDWLSAAPTSGAVPAGGGAPITVTLNAANLPGGVYAASLNVASNDPDENPLVIPVTLTVGAAPEPVALAVIPMTSTVGRGQAFSVQVRVQSGSQLVDGAAAYLNFDPAYVQVTSLTPGSTLPVVLQSSYDNALGRIDFAAGTFPPFPSGDFTLVTVNFTALNAMTGANGTPLAFNTASPRKSDITYSTASVLDEARDGAVVITSDVTLNGSVSLQGRPAPPHARWVTPLTLTLTVGGSPAYVFTPTTTSTGQFTLNGLAPGVYDALVKNSHSLENKKLALSLPVSGAVGFGVLLEGDANDDNAVGLLDFSILIAAYGKCQGAAGYDDRADFNEDQCVTLLDFTLLAANFGRSGPVIVGAESAAEPQVGTVDLVIEPLTTTVQPGGEFTITVQVVAGTKQVYGAQASLDFDPAALQALEILPGPSLPLTLTQQYDNAAGALDFAAGTFSNFPTGTFTLAQIRFKAQAAVVGAFPLTFHTDLPRVTDVTSGTESVLREARGGGVVVGFQSYLPVVMR